MKKIALCIAFLFPILSGCGDSPEEQKPAAAETRQVSDFNAAPTINKIKPESMVVFPKSGLACLSIEGLQAAVTHAAKGEETKMLAMMINPKTKTGECIMLSPDKRYKVISSEYHDEAKTGVGLLELVGEGNMSANGAWALSVGAELVK